MSGGNISFGVVVTRLKGMNTLRAAILAMLVLAAYVSATAKAGEKNQNEAATPSFAVTKEWPISNKPFRGIKEEIDSQIKKGKNPDELVEGAKSAFIKDKSPLALFRWAYAAQKSALAPQPARPFDEAKITDVYEVMQESANGKAYQAYDFIRLYYLLGTEVEPPVSTLQLGEKLLRFQPNDIDVESQQVNLLMLTGVPANLAKAVIYAKDLIRRDPTDANAYASLAGVYYTQWLVLNSKAYAKKAAAEYQEYLRLAPANDYFREDVDYMLKQLRQSNP